MPGRIRLLVHHARPWAMALSLCLGTAVALADEFVPLPAPEGARMSSLGDRMRINGARAKLSEIAYAGKSEDLLQFYRDKFDGGGFSSPSAAGGGVSAVVGLIEGNLVTVRIASSANGRVVAQVMQSLPEDLRASTSPEALAKVQAEMPPQSQRLSEVESFDRGANSRLVVYRNEHSVDANIDFVRQRLEGMKLAQAERRLDAATQVTTVWYSGGAGSDARLSVHDAGGRRTVTLNVVKSMAVQEEKP